MDTWGLGWGPTSSSVLISPANNVLFLVYGKKKQKRETDGRESKRSSAERKKKEQNLE